MISQAEVERIFSEKELENRKIYSIGNIGFDESELDISLDVFLQYLSFSGSFSTFHEMLVDWSLKSKQKEKIKECFGAIAQYFMQSRELKEQMLKKTIYYEKNESQTVFVSFLQKWKNEPGSVEGKRVMIKRDKLDRTKPKIEIV